MFHQLEPQAAAHGQVVSDSFSESIHRPPPGHGNAKVCKAATSDLGVNRRRVWALMPQQLANLIQRASVPKQVRG